MTLRRLARLRLLDSRCFLENSKSYFREIALFPILLFFRFALRFGHVESCHRSKVFGWDRKEKPAVQVNQLVISPDAAEGIRVLQLAGMA